MNTEQMMAKYIADGGTITVCEDKLNGSDTKVVRSRTSRSTPIQVGYKVPYMKRSTSINYTGSNHDTRSM